MGEKLEQLLTVVYDRINEPSKDFGDIEPMEVRDYRHKLFRDFEPLFLEIRKSFTQTT